MAKNSWVPDVLSIKSIDHPAISIDHPALGPWGLGPGGLVHRQVLTTWTPRGLTQWPLPRELLSAEESEDGVQVVPWWPSSWGFNHGSRIR